ncbi:MAG TPA: hypothetical protein PKY82_29020 [Pyrinomonadaceae bacterium]|nr:hypothetical protein [Pyrinomonadaceae bacterium]
MFCPKCSQLQTSDALRFCSRCGFALEIIKDLVEGGNSIKAKSETEKFPIRQKDISIGAGLMFVSGIVAVIWGFIIGSGSPDVIVSQAFFILGFALAFILLFFHPILNTLHKIFGDDGKQSEENSRQQNGINLGAILMFIGTLKAMLIATFLQPSSRALMTLLMLTGGFLVLLIIRWLVQTIYQLFFKGETTSEDVISLQATSDKTMQLQDSSGEQFALPSTLSNPADDFISLQRTKEMVEPLSVTEETTKFLDK